MELVHHFGVLVRNPSTGAWSVLDDGTAHLPQGLTGVTVTPQGYLQVTYPQLARVGSFQVTPDETWAGKYHPGASVGFDHAFIIIRNSSGAVVPAGSLVGNGNLWVDAWGWVDAPATPAS